MPNLNDVVSWIQRIEDRLDRLKSGAFLEQASITKGILRIIGGLLRIDSGGRLEGEGHFGWSGPIYLDGDVEVTKTLDVTAATRLRGETTIEGIARLLSELVVEGKITAGKIRIENGTIYVGEGANQIVIDGATGQIIAGGMRINPGTNGGQIEFGDGRTINAGSNYLGIYDGDRFVLFNEAGVTVYAGGASISFSDEGVRASGLVNHTDMEGRSWVTVDNSGLLGMIDPAYGGPGAGQFEYPFPQSTITYGFRPPDRPTHDGLDMAGPGVTGQMIPAAARGVVSFAGGSGGTTGYGYYVIIDHGIVNGDQVETLYGHMKTAPVVSVGQTVQKLELLGPVGNTGNSFGDHLHWEIRVNGSPVDPQVFMQRFTG